MDLRRRQVDDSHVKRLVEVFDDLPPVVVHASSMLLLDGVHRVEAARLLGRTSVNAVFFGGDRVEALEAAIVGNTAHGLPLTAGERRAAASRLLVLVELDWADRRVARCCGISPTTVSRIRAELLRAGVQPGHLDGSRVGGDGKRYPGSGRAVNDSRHPRTARAVKNRPRKVAAVFRRVLQVLWQALRRLDLRPSATREGGGR